MVVSGQDAVVEAVAAWRQAAKPGIAFENHRRTNGGLLRLVLRLWRERVEIDAPGLNTSEERWRVRRQKQRPQQQQRVGLRDRKTPAASQSAPTQTSKFAAVMNSIGEWAKLRESFKWSPWFAQKPAQNDSDALTEEDTGRLPTGTLRAWRLRSQCLQVASYYRVVGSHERSAGQRRLLAARNRFQRWATSYLMARRDGATQRRAAETEEEERQRRGDRASARTRMARVPKNVYRSGVRAYKPRDPQHVIDKRRLGRIHRTQITSAAEIGLRLHENLRTIALRCVKERRGDG